MHFISPAARLLYAVLIVHLALLGEYGMALANFCVFLGSGFLPWLGQKDTRYKALDAYSMLVFSGYILVWFTPLAAGDGGLFGMDKFFHVLGGLGLAWFLVLQKWPVWQVLVGVLVLGVAWELFEYVMWLLPGELSLHHNGLTDSLLDLVADMVGALFFLLRQPFKWKFPV